ncbi:MAG: guanylate kinase [Candidatus Omnitrophica bacterium]|nr:guanylate kinase [Candidatus Omnitrophota bacterium]
MISAPSGCGKTTIVDRLLKRHSSWVRSISMTTRSPRTDEKNGKDYYFVSPEEFADIERRGDLLESAKVFDKLYGTPKSFVLKHLNEGKNVILAIDVQGTKKVKEALGSDVSLLTIFLLPPSVKVLRERLEGRKTDSAEEIERRMEWAQEEIKEASIYDHTVINHNLEKSVHEVETLIKKFQNSKENQ